MLVFIFQFIYFQLQIHLVLGNFNNKRYTVVQSITMYNNRMRCKCVIKHCIGLLVIVSKYLLGGRNIHNNIHHNNDFKIFPNYRHRQSHIISIVIDILICL